MKLLLFVYYIAFILLINKSYAVWCGLIGNYVDDPHPNKLMGNSYYIGFTEYDCRNVYICGNKSEVNIPNCNGINGICVNNWVPVYRDCYDRNGKV